MLNGLAKDGGLYVPNKIPKYSKKQLNELKQLDYSQLAYELTFPFVRSDEITSDSYMSICRKTYDDSFGKVISIDKLNDVNTYSIYFMDQLLHLKIMLFNYLEIYTNLF